MLTRLGFSVDVSEDAEAAQRWFLSGQSADFVFSDVVMPGGMNGIELAQWLEAHHPEVRVLLTSGFPDSYAATNPRARLLRKPFRLEQLRGAIHASLDLS